ncbi:MAG TPA: dienelactone hydrolase family protein [Ornithinibacter sp.]|nr:dienelactone hydrolase family protein [Ornithinibacter sp.]
MGEVTTVGDLPAYRAVPSGDGPWPGMVLVHELFGLDDVMRRHADRLAGMGYLVLAPDLMARGRRVVCLARTMTALRRGSGPAFEEIEAARSVLAADPRCTGAIGVVGFCMGGGFALLLAGRPGWDAAVVNYGVLPADLGALDGACPVVASYGGRDRYLSGAAGRLERALTERGVVHDVKEYPAAGHAFLNDEDVAPWYLAPMSRLVMRAGPEPASAEDAWGRIEGFLQDHLTR